MGDKSKIEWTDATWNPIVAFNRQTGKRGWFCTHVSDGCRFCYAERINRVGGTGLGYAAEDLKEIEIRLLPEVLEQPLRWKRPRKIFVSSMVDLFHEAVGDDFLDSVFASVALAQRHIFQILTKRPQRMMGYLGENCSGTTRHIPTGSASCAINAGKLVCPISSRHGVNGRRTALLPMATGFTFPLRGRVIG